MNKFARILAAVPARGGSKRIPRKNVLRLGRFPLITWTLKTASESGVCTDVIVSTDDQETADIARAFGGTVPLHRPEELATDTTSTIKVLTHALEWYEKNFSEVDAVLLLQPTSPFRSAHSIIEAVNVFIEQSNTEKRTVVSVSPAENHPYWTFFISNGELVPSIGWEKIALRSQDLLPAYTVNGSIYVIPAEDVRKGRDILRRGIIPFIISDSSECLDIDTIDDWNRALLIADDKYKTQDKL